METYIGTKIINAEPMTEREWLFTQNKLVSSMNAKYREGYKVVYEDGYTSWSPKETFERAYRKVSYHELLMIKNLICT